jgi:aminoglycoside phosphotransferase (APT) family kinase protein
MHPPTHARICIPVTTIDDWLELANKMIHDLDLPQFERVLEWMERHRPRGQTPTSLIHGDYHPRNILIDEDARPFVIDWASAQQSDFRFDLAWTLLLTASSAGENVRTNVLRSYERQAGATVNDLEFFEVAACARRLADILVSLRDGPGRMGMRTEAAAMMMGQRGHIEVANRLLEHRTGMRIADADHVLPPSVLALNHRGDPPSG